MSNQTAIYQYTWKQGWIFDASEHGPIGHYPSDNEIIADVQDGLKKATFEKISEKFAQLGRWLIVDSVNVDIATLERYPPVGGVSPPTHVTGTTTAVFRSDATPDADFTPLTGSLFMGWDDVIIAISLAILTAIIAHPVLFFILLIILALTWFAISGGFKGVLFGTGSGDFGTIGTFIILGVVVIGALVVLPRFLGARKER